MSLESRGRKLTAKESRIARAAYEAFKQTHFFNEVNRDYYMSYDRLIPQEQEKWFDIGQSAIEANKPERRKA